MRGLNPENVIVTSVAKNKISKFPQVGKMSTDSNIFHTSVRSSAGQLTEAGAKVSRVGTGTCLSDD